MNSLGRMTAARRWGRAGRHAPHARTPVAGYRTEPPTPFCLSRIGRPVALPVGRFGIPTRRALHFTSSLRGPGGSDPMSLGARLKKLTREYGWLALGVYIGLSVLDFPFCFLLVKAFGAEKIGAVEHWVVSKAKSLIPQPVRDRWRDLRQTLERREKAPIADEAAGGQVEAAAGWDVQKPEHASDDAASLAAQLAVAYAVHKSLIFLRIPLAVAVTPPVARALRSWGWQVGKRV